MFLEPISRTAGPVFTNFCVFITYGLRSILWQHYNMVCLSSFMNDILFAHHGQELQCEKAYSQSNLTGCCMDLTLHQGALLDQRWSLISTIALFLEWLFRNFSCCLNGSSPCRQQGHVAVKLKCWCWLIQFDLYNSHKTSGWVFVAPRRWGIILTLPAIKD